ncbi:MAG: minor capsid protein [Butyricicoccus sp.]|nr:minor capsid protein [Butyricicoccus sp.]
MTSQEYWRQREAAQRKKNLTSEAEYQKEIQRIYTEMLDSIQQEIDSFYAKYAEKEGITLAQAKQRVSRLDIEEYQRKAAKYVKDRDFSDQANAEMRLYNLTMKINRLEMLKANIGMELVESFDELQKFFGEKLTNRALDEFERLAGIFGDTVQNNAKRAATIVNASFHHATFSDRIWMYQDVLKSELSKLLEQGIIQGKGSRELARSLRRVFDTSRSDAERLMSTELRRVQTEAAKQSYEANENDEYEFMTANAQGPCDVCKKLNGKTFKVKDMLPGKNAPPMHPRCHCCTAPHWDEAKFQAYLREENRKMHQRDGAKKVAENSRRGIIKENIYVGKSLGAASKNYPIRLPSGNHAKLAADTEITKIKVFAGAGTDVPIRVAEKLENEYGIKAEKWQKVRGDAYIMENHVRKHVELHWYEASGERVYMKVKRYFDNEG